MSYEFSNYKLMYEKKNFYLNLAVNILIYLVSFISIIFLIFSYIFYPSKVDGSSMKPTFNDGNYNKQAIFVNRFADYERGDIVIIKKQNLTDEKEKYIIKRVIAVGGDTVQLVKNPDKSVDIYLNNSKLNETYTLDYKNGTTKGMKEKYLQYKALYDLMPDLFPNGLDGGILVPKDYIFALGDNRENSEDSLRVGPFHISQLDGRVDFTVPQNENPLIFLIKYFTPF